MSTFRTTLTIFRHVVLSPLTLWIWFGRLLGGIAALIALGIAYPCREIFYRYVWRVKHLSTDRAEGIDEETAQWRKNLVERYNESFSRQWIFEEYSKNFFMGVDRISHGLELLFYFIFLPIGGLLAIATIVVYSTFCFIRMIFAVPCIAFWRFLQWLWKQCIKFLRLVMQTIDEQLHFVLGRKKK